MLSQKEKEYIFSKGYIPEHIPDYVCSITGGEPFLVQDHLYYVVNEQLFFIGYPLQGSFDEKIMADSLNTVIETCKPEVVSLIAPKVTPPENQCLKSEIDQYYRLNISELSISQKTRNMIQRAGKELVIEKGRDIKDEHLDLISEFVETHTIDDERKYIFDRVPQYVSDVSTATVISAIDSNGQIVAYDIVDFGSKDYAFYMFNFRSKELSVPGASDLLLHEVITMTVQKGKSFINLGLGMNEGNIFFKKKWGGISFLDYQYCQYSSGKREGLLSLLMKF